MNKQLKEYGDIWDRSKELLQQGRSMDLIHTRISLDFALRLLEKLGGDPEIVIPAIMLHDIGNMMIRSDNLEQETIDPGTDSAKKVYSFSVKQKHLTEGAKLSRKILEELRYSEELIEAIVDIVGDHESVKGGPPEDRDNLNKIIVSDADKLYRYSANGFFAMCRVHDIREEEMLSLNFQKMEEWLYTENAKKIAAEEMRKMPNAESIPQLVEI
ncbi:HD domain-containing protein [Thermodesulfobacteriota bacterium]